MKKAMPSKIPANVQESSATGGFSHWFQNVFWYHYKWYFLGSLFIAVLAVFFVVTIASSSAPDFSYILALEGVEGSLPLDDWDIPAAQRLADLDGDGKVTIGSRMLGLTDSQMGMASHVVFTAELMSGDCLLMVLDEATLSRLGDAHEQSKALLALSELGLPSEADRPWLARVAPPPILRAVGYTEDCFLCIKGRSSGAASGKNAGQAYEQAALFAEMLLEMSQ